ncbi:hypothetical protein IAU59_000470 [Kwoniella sp. CBS 9459]
MLASDTYNSLEAWVECDHRRLNESPQVFSHATRRSPPTYTCYIEISHPSSSVYTFHMRNTDLSSWLGDLLVDTSIDNIPLYTDYVRPIQGHEVAIDRLAAYADEVKNVEGADMERRQAVEEERKAGDDLPIRAVQVDSTASALDSSQSIPLLGSLEQSMGKIEISFFRGQVVHTRPSLSLYDTVDPKCQNASFEAFEDDHVDPWVRFVFVYGTQAALEANGITVPRARVPTLAQTDTSSRELGLNTTIESESISADQAHSLRVLVPATPEPESPSVRKHATSDSSTTLLPGSALRYTSRSRASAARGQDSKDSDHAVDWASLLDFATGFKLEADPQNGPKDLSHSAQITEFDMADKAAQGTDMDLLSLLPDLPQIELDQSLREEAEAMTASQASELAERILQYATAEDDNRMHEEAFRADTIGQQGIVDASTAPDSLTHEKTGSLYTTGTSQSGSKSDIIRKRGSTGRSTRRIIDYQHFVTTIRHKEDAPRHLAKTSIKGSKVKARDFAYALPRTSVRSIADEKASRGPREDKLKHLVSSRSLASSSSSVTAPGLKPTGKVLPVLREPGPMRRTDKDDRRYLGSLAHGSHKKGDEHRSLRPDQYGFNGGSSRAEIRTSRAGVQPLTKLEGKSQHGQRRIDDYPKKSAFESDDRKRRKTERTSSETRHPPKRPQMPLEQRGRGGGRSVEEAIDLTLSDSDSE